MEADRNHELALHNETAFHSCEQQVLGKTVLKQLGMEQRSDLGKRVCAIVAPRALAEWGRETLSGIASSSDTGQPRQGCRKGKGAGWLNGTDRRTAVLLAL